MYKINFAQISDCHLFADKNARHHHANVYQHLCAVLANIKQNKLIDFIVFTGDLSQDHSEASYQNFVDAITQAAIKIPVYFVAGNHDEHNLLNRFLDKSPFQQAKVIDKPHWQIILLNSKSDTPAGYFEQDEFTQLMAKADAEKTTLVMMHHHAIDLGYFIDRHHLNNQTEFWHAICEHKQIKAVACGHVHRAEVRTYNGFDRSIPLYTCPATSIQFDPQADTVKALPLPPAYRLFCLSGSGDIQTNIIQVEC
ncbi:metallophosphoesterase [Thalassotalea sp. PLHSN55]|uniref:metallophosphoesterase n=1 Tax=Thalassotalea sp. PLHSN55 TaxID=3435888 RepID=UPI003F862CE4